MNRWIGSIVLMVCAVLVSPSVMAQAALTINITHQGDDVVADISGQVDLSGMNSVGGPAPFNTEISSGALGSKLYLSSSTNDQVTQRWRGLQDAPNFPTEDFWDGDRGSNSELQSTSSGDSFIGLETGNSSQSVDPVLVLPASYSSGDQIDFEVRWDDVTVTDLNLNPGVYAWEAPDVSTQSDNVVVLIIESPPAPTTFTIGGSVSGLASGKSVELVNNGGDALLVNADGNFTFATNVSSGAAYAVTVNTQPNGQSCEIDNGTGSAAANVTNVQVTCIAAAPALPVPTLSMWLLAVMALLMVIAGVWNTRLIRYS